MSRRARRSSLSEFTKKELGLALEVVMASPHTQQWAKSELLFLGVDIETEEGKARFEKACKRYAMKIIY